MENRKTIALDNPLWVYAVAVYQAQGMKAIFLDLQDEGFEVNIILALLWLSDAQKNISTQQLHELLKLSRLSIMMKFREVRHLLKNDEILNNYYRDMLALELKLEQKEIAHYYLQLTEFTMILGGADSARKNLETYSKLLNKKPSDRFKPLLLTHAANKKDDVVWLKKDFQPND